MSQLLDRLHGTSVCSSDAEVSGLLSALRPKDIEHFREAGLAALHEAERLLHLYACGCEEAQQRVARLMYWNVRDVDRELRRARNDATQACTNGLRSDPVSYAPNLKAVT